MCSKTLISHVVFQKYIDFSQRLIRNNFHLNCTSRITSESIISFRNKKKSSKISQLLRKYLPVLFVAFESSFIRSCLCFCFTQNQHRLCFIFFLTVVSSSHLRCKFLLASPLCCPSSVLGEGTSILVRDAVHSRHSQAEPCKYLHSPSTPVLVAVPLQMLMSLKQAGERTVKGRRGM